MAETAATQAPAAATPAAPPAVPAVPAAPGENGQPAGIDWGRVIDGAGICAAVILLVIVADIFSDGRLVSRRLMRNREQPPQPQPDPLPGQ